MRLRQRDGGINGDGGLTGERRSRQRDCGSHRVRGSPGGGVRGGLQELHCVNLCVITESQRKQKELPSSLSCQPNGPGGRSRLVCLAAPAIVHMPWNFTSCVDVKVELRLKDKKKIRRNLNPKDKGTIGASSFALRASSSFLFFPQHSVLMPTSCSAPGVTEPCCTRA